MSEPTASSLFDLLRRQLNTSAALPERAASLSKALQYITTELLRDRGVRFPNFFARLSFLIRELELTRTERHYLQSLRVRTKRGADFDWTEEEWRQCWSACVLFVSRACDTPPPEDLRPDELKLPQDRPHQIDLRLLRVVITEQHANYLNIEDVSGTPYQLLKKEHPVYEDTFETACVGDTLSLIDCARREEESREVLQARLIVYEPDYLIDVSSLAECFAEIARHKVATPASYFLSRYRERQNTEALFLGNLANTFLDKLVFEPADRVSFRRFFAESFQETPLEYVELFTEDQLLADFMKYKALPQFTHLNRVINNDLTRLRPPIDVNRCTLEPTFLSPELGLQGRLDLLHLDDEATIIELKSGKPPWPPEDHDALGENHAAQARLYRMLLHQVLGIPNRAIHVYLLYSSATQAGANLRYVARVAALEQQLMAVRNAIVRDEKRMLEASEPQELHPIFRSWNYASTGIPADARVPDWFVEKFSVFQDELTHLTPLSRDYLYAYSIFIAREQWLGRVGDGRFRKGHSALWNKDDSVEGDDKLRMGPLTIVDNRIGSKEPRIRMSLGALDAAGFDFRKGDICVLFPLDSADRKAVDGQVLKCFLAEEPDEDNTIVLGFRFPQRFKGIFEICDEWAIEHDYLDSGFRTMQRELFAFAGAKDRMKDLLMLNASPGAPDLENPPQRVPSAEVPLEASRAELDLLLHKALEAPDYFLLVGPPGTGKTSLFLKHLVSSSQERGETLLLLAYTNRAVDEICEAVIDALGQQAAFVRIGSGNSCDKRYHPYLLHRLAAKAQNRSELSALISAQKVVVSTVSSILSRSDIFRLKVFDRIVVDEASQVLEPMLVNLLRKSGRFVLIGDDKQLPAVVQQERGDTALLTENLKEIGLTDLSNSLFERLLMAARRQQWDHCWGTLTYQGRLHPHLLEFVNKQWYGGILHPAERPHQNEAALLGEDWPELLRSRWLYLTSGAPTGDHPKTHPEEALLVAEVVKKLAAQINDPVQLARSVGVIAPYRNQIARIKGALRDSNIIGAEYITVDTVERYQGSQRDHIIYSTTVGSPEQLRFLTSNKLMNPLDGTLVDRKLNVAVTRARKQFVLIGYVAVLQSDDQYAALIDHVRTNGKVFSGAEVLSVAEATS